MAVVVRVEALKQAANAEICTALSLYTRTAPRAEAPERVKAVRAAHAVHHCPLPTSSMAKPKPRTCPPPI